MQEATQIINWLSVAVILAYTGVQILAFRRFNGDQRKRGDAVFLVMLVVTVGSDAIQDVFFFENRTARRVAQVVIVTAATAVLVAMFGKNQNAKADNREGAEHSVETLKLG